MVPEGSKSNVDPLRLTFAMERRTSSFVEVTTLGDVAMSRLGIINDDVLPLRLGPNTNVERWWPLIATPRSDLPR